MQTASELKGRGSEPPEAEILPNVELTEDLMFALLKSEFAFQRGDWQSAYVATVGAAQQTRDPRLARRAAEMAIAAKQSETALSAVRLWRSLAPQAEEATQYYLSLIVFSDNVAEARPLLEERLREARPQTRGLLMLQIQRLLARAKDKQAAFTLLEEVLARYQGAPEAHLALAQAAHGRGDDERAQREARLALNAKPNSDLAALTLAQVTPNGTAAAKVLADFLAANPSAREVRLAYARMLVEQRQYMLAHDEFARLLKEQPQDLTSLFALGALSAQTKQFAAAEKHLTTYLDLLEKNPDQERDPAQAQLLLAQIAEERSDPIAAMQWLAQVEPGDAYVGAQIQRARIMAKRGALNEARHVLQTLKLDGERDQVQAILTEAQLLKEFNHLPEALTVLGTGLRRFPNNADLLYDYAMAAEKNNELEAMEKALRRIMELAPQNQHAYNALGYSLAERNIRLAEAKELIEKALQLAPEDPFIIDSMGWVLYRLGRLKEAETMLRRAYAIRPDAEIAAHLGEVLWVSGQKGAAQKFWRDAKEKDPKNDTLNSTLARLNVSL